MVTETYRFAANLSRWLNVLQHLADRHLRRPDSCHLNSLPIWRI